MLKNILVKKVATLFPGLLKKIAIRFYPYDLININLDLTYKEQKRILICYLNMLGENIHKIEHPSRSHLNQMILYFIKRGYCIDLCFCLDLNAYERLKENKYDIILGFGTVFKAFCKNSDIRHKILFITENYPEVVRIKYEERLMYLLERHPSINLKKSLARNQFYDIEQIELANYGIIMTSNFNAAPFKNKLNKLWTINANIIENEQFVFYEKQILEYIPNNRKRFLWFGSAGIIHKGLDILLDVFKDMPDFELNCYGIRQEEKQIFNRLKSKNVHDKGFLNVCHKSFIDEVVFKHNFLVFPSCSEGMSTAVATCMAHGIIPIVTKETGFESASCIIQLEDYKIETIYETIIKVSKWNTDKILTMRKECYKYAKKNFSLKKFDESFSHIMNEILEK